MAVEQLAERTQRALGLAQLGEVDAHVEAREEEALIAIGQPGGHDPAIARDGLADLTLLRVELAELHGGMGTVLVVDRAAEHQSERLRRADLLALVCVEPSEVETRFLVCRIGSDGLVEQPAALFEGALDALEPAVEHVARLGPVDAA